MIKIRKEDNRFAEKMFGKCEKVLAIIKIGAIMNIEHLFVFGGVIMTVSIIFDAALVILAGCMILTGRFGRTRQAGFAPLVTAVLDGAFAAQIDAAATPILSAILLVLQAVVLVAGAVALYQDRVQAKKKATRRRRRREIARCRAAFEQAAEQQRASLRICA